jgi:hypothetical protein
MANTIIRIDQNAVVARVMGQWDKALPMLTEEILNDCNQYCKEDTGTLIQSSMIHSDFKRGIMKWVTPYARRQYWEIRTAYKDVNPRATWKWVHVAKAKYQAKWARQAARLMGVKS